MEEQITDEHRSIEELLVELETLLAQGEPRPTHLLDKLGILRSRLVAHFETEGDSDLYTQVSARSPQLASELAELRVEHGSILEMFQDTQAATRRLAEIRAEARELLSGLIASVRAHEQAEAEILRKGLG